MTDSTPAHDLDAVVAALAARRPRAGRDPREPGRRRDRFDVGRRGGAALARQAGAHLPARTTRRSRTRSASSTPAGSSGDVDPAALEGGRCWPSTAATSAGSGPEHGEPAGGGGSVVDVDHHHDNSRFGDVNLVIGTRVLDRRDPGATYSTGWGSQLTPADRRGPLRRPGHRHRPLPVPHDESRSALRLGARLVEAGADVHKVFELVFESRAFGKLLLLGRVIDKRRLLPGRARCSISHVTRDDLRAGRGRRGHHRGPDRQPAARWRASRWPA